jgi:hypothetical protein
MGIREMGKEGGEINFIIFEMLEKFKKAYTLT